MSPSQLSRSLDLTVDARSSYWLEQTLTLLRETGFAIVLDIVPEMDRDRAREGFSCAHEAQRREIPERVLAQALASPDYDLRLLPKYDPFFYRFLEYPAQLALIDAYLSPSAILRFQHGTVIPAGHDPHRPGPWHMNFRRVLNGYRAALEVGFSIDGVQPGAYYFALGSHQRPEPPDAASLAAAATTFLIPPGAMFVFDGTLWHHEGDLVSDAESCLVLHEFVHHFFKPHVDYVRALGESTVEALPARTRRLLGWESRVPASIEQFYVDPADRLYLPGQG